MIFGESINEIIVKGVCIIIGTFSMGIVIRGLLSKILRKKEERK